MNSTVCHDEGGGSLQTTIPRYCRLVDYGLPVSIERRDRMLVAVEHVEGFEPLRAVVKRMLDEGIAGDALLEDLSQIRGLVSPDDEETVLDVMDLLTGWCAPQFRLIPPEDQA